MNKVLNIRHSGIVVRNLKTALKFYVKLLGMKILSQGKLDQYDVLKWLGVVDSNLKYVKLITEDGGSVLELYEFENKEFTEHYFKIREHPNFFEFNHVSFSVDDAEEMAEKLYKAGIECISKPSIDETCKYHLFFCRDEDNNLLELVERIK